MHYLEAEADSKRYEGEYRDLRRLLGQQTDASEEGRAKDQGRDRCELSDGARGGGAEPTQSMVHDELGEDGARHVGARQLLEHDGGLDVTQARAAPLLAHGDPEEPGLPQRVPRGLRELLGLVPVPGPRCKLAFGNLARELAQRRLVLGLGEGVRP